MNKLVGGTLATCPSISGAHACLFCVVPRGFGPHKPDLGAGVPYFGRKHEERIAACSWQVKLTNSWFFGAAFEFWSNSFMQQMRHAMLVGEKSTFQSRHTYLCFIYLFYMANSPFPSEFRPFSGSRAATTNKVERPYNRKTHLTDLARTLTLCWGCRNPTPRKPCSCSGV